MNVLVSGSSGFVGSALVPSLMNGGHRVVRLVRERAAAGPDAVFWDPAAGELDAARLVGLDAVVHLAGENIAAGRWSDARKRRLRESRVAGTQLLAERLAATKSPPRVLVAASAVGFYGNRGDEVLTEASPPGKDFLADLCRDWEAAAQPAKDKGVRVVHLRLGMVLSPAGGALAKMLLPFRLGAGGRMGSGRQYWSWIALDDVIAVIERALTDGEISGPVNTVAPQAVTNAEFTRALGKALRRPTVFPMPAFAARMVFGELADALFFASQRVEPRRLLDRGHDFRFPELEGALRHLLGRGKK